MLRPVTHDHTHTARPPHLVLDVLDLFMKDGHLIVQEHVSVACLGLDVAEGLGELVQQVLACVIIRIELLWKM